MYGEDQGNSRAFMFLSPFPLAEVGAILKHHIVKGKCERKKMASTTLTAVLLHRLLVARYQPWEECRWARTRQSVRAVVPSAPWVSAAHSRNDSKAIPSIPCCVGSVRRQDGPDGTEYARHVVGGVIVQNMTKMG